jgi:hypothetical protein
MTASVAPIRSAASPFPARAREAGPLAGPATARRRQGQFFLTGEGSFNAVGRQQGEMRRRREECDEADETDKKESKRKSRKTKA